MAPAFGPGTPLRGTGGSVKKLRFEILSAMIVENDKTLTVFKLRVMCNHGSCLLKASVRSCKNPFITIHEIYNKESGISLNLIQRFNEIKESDIVQEVVDFLLDNDRVKP